MLLHADSTKAIRSPYQMVTINYFPTSVQRLYRIGTTGEWLNYQDQAVRVNQGETIYAKGIDQYGNETRITSSYTANVTDAIGAAAYDGDINTSFAGYDKYLKIDSSMEGKKIYIKGGATNSSIAYINFSFLDEQKNLISTISNNAWGTVTLEGVYTIPQGTRYIRQWGSGTNFYLYEITPQP